MQITAKGGMTAPERIISIAENTHDDEHRFMGGYKIITDKQTILLLMDNGQQCCENHGYLLSEDDTDYYVGALLLDIKVTDTALDKITTHLKELGDWTIPETLFVDLETDKGVLQFAAYNAHNGYYGHDVVIGSTTLAVKETL